MNRLLLATTSFFMALAASPAAYSLELNTATARQLEQLDGIGAAVAKRIVAERRRDGDFLHWDDLQARVRGISERKASELASQGLTVAGETHRRVFVAKVPKQAASAKASRGGSDNTLVGR